MFSVCFCCSLIKSKILLSNVKKCLAIILFSIHTKGDSKKLAVLHSNFILSFFVFFLFHLIPLVLVLYFVPIPDLYKK